MPGNIIRADDVNSLTDSARVARGITTTGMIESRITPHGISIVPTPIAVPTQNSVWAKYIGTGSSAMLYGVVELYDSVAGHTNSTIQTCRTAAQSGHARVGVVVGSTILENKIGWVQTRGIVSVWYQGWALKIGQRLGVRKNTQYAYPDKGGPFVVTHIPNAYVGAATGIVEVEIIGRRLDSKIVNCDAAGGDSDNASGPYYTIIYANSAGTPVRTSPGKLVTS